MAAPSPEPFRLDVPQATLDDLRARLERTRWPDEIPGSDWRYGSNLDYVQRLVERWRNGFDWRTHEAELNAFDQYRVPLGGVDLHFIHQPGVGPDPTPLLLVHGWPGSVWEFHDLIPRLTDPARFGGDPADAFTVVAPSLPGYTLSYRPGQPRFDVGQMGDLFAELMTDVLGYERFAAQGGDWGGYVVACLAAGHPEKLVGIHLNFLPVRQRPPVPRPALRRGRDVPGGARASGRRRRPATTRSRARSRRRSAYALTDSPAGLAGWIVEKFQTWSDYGGDFEALARRWTRC